MPRTLRAATTLEPTKEQIEGSVLATRDIRVYDETVDEGELTEEEADGWHMGEAGETYEEEKDESDFLGAAMDEATNPPIHVTVCDGVVAVEESDEESDEPIWDDAIERKKDEDSYAVELKTAQDKLIEAAMECDDAKGRLKDAKSYEKLSLDYLKSLVVTGVRYRKKPEPKNDHVDTSFKTVAGEVIPAIEPNTSTEWRSWETASILDGIEGLGAKKRDSLLESFPTFGHLMDARTEAGKEHVPFHSMLPKGIGESIGTELIERMDKKIVPGF